MLFLKGIPEDAQLNYEQNMQDAMDVFHKLQTGLDVNVKFTGFVCQMEAPIDDSKLLFRSSII